jgi:cob(I)alamin adenosyltransferase
MRGTSVKVIMDTQNQEFDKKMALETWQQAEQYLKDKAINLVVLDELTYMINYKYLDEQVILNTLNARYCYKSICCVVFKG